MITLHIKQKTIYKKICYNSFCLFHLDRSRHLDNLTPLKFDSIYCFGLQQMAHFRPNLSKCLDNESHLHSNGFV